MNCPHCKKKMDISPTEWRIWYCEDICNRISKQTGGNHLINLIRLKGGGGPVHDAMKSMENFVGAICLAWHRGELSGKESKPAASGEGE